MNRLLLALATATVALSFAAPADAVVYVEGTGEPAFTNTTTNTQWVRWQGNSAYEKYQLEFDHYDNTVFKTTEVAPVAANGSGTSWVNWQGIVTPLLEGHTYSVCAYGRYWIGGIPARDTGSCFDADQSGKRASTTIDLTDPTIAVKIDDGAAYSRTAKLNYHIDYSDNLAFPFPANFVCRDIGTDPAQACANATLAYNEACSVPLGGAKKVTYFNCDEDLSGANVPDGPVTLCVVSADAAIPDNPYGANQSASATSANLSSKSCDSIVIDRAAPALAAVASATSVQAGDLVTMTAQAADAASGLSGAYTWTWGDNTAEGSGASAAHAYTAPGTYQVTVKTKDNAGNETTATTTITVAARTTSGGGGTTSTGGGSAPPPTAVGGLEVLAPKRVKLGRKPVKLAIALTAPTPGRATLALVRAGRIHAQAATALGQAGTTGYRMALPRKLRAGSYRLKISFTGAGATTATTKTVKLIVAGAKAKKARASAASSAGIDLTGAPVGMPDGRAG